MHLNELVKLKSYEKLEILLRRHPITFFSIFFLFLFLAAVPFGLYFLFTNTNALLNVETYRIVATLATSAFYLFLYILFFSLFIDYHFDMWILTNDRLIDINQKGLFSRIVTELDLYLIQEVTSEQHGFFGHIFDYGDVHIQSAGAVPRVIFKDIPHPHNVRNLLIKLADYDRKYHAGTGH